MVVTRSANADVKVFIATVVLCLLFVGGSTAVAEPYLQLDADPAIYLGVPVESILATEAEFTLYALVNSNDSAFNLTETFYLSAAVTPRQDEIDPAPDLGSFVLGSLTIDVTGDMVYGTPPLDVDLDPKDLADHGIFETYYYEQPFTLDPAKTTGLYNSQDTPGGPSVAGSDLYYQDFEVDVSGVASGYTIHFDLYTMKTIERQGELVNVIADFAPFSHDLETVPTPGALMLGVMGIGMVNSFLRRKRSFVS